MLPDHRAEKVQRAAAIAAEIGVEELRRQAAAGTGGRLLRRFPGIGEPGADRLLLLAGGKRTLAPDSNALRVLVRLGLGTAGGNYRRRVPLGGGGGGAAAAGRRRMAAARAPAAAAAWTGGLQARRAPLRDLPADAVCAWYAGGGSSADTRSPGGRVAGERENASGVNCLDPEALSRS